MWDYHVITCHRGGDGGALVVYDFDSTLPFPCAARQYVDATFKPQQRLKSQYQRLFRVVRGKEAADSYSCDRSHMRNADGTWKAPPPPYKCYERDSSNNLSRFIDMSDTGFMGRLMDLEGFVSWLDPLEAAPPGSPPL